MMVYYIKLQWQRNLTHNLFIKIKLKKKGKKPIIKNDNHYCKFHPKKKTNKQTKQKQKQKPKTKFDSFCRTRFWQQREMKVGTNGKTI